MDMWVCMIFLHASVRSFDMQNEDAVVISAKEMTSTFPAVIGCINQFSGKVLWFKDGKQVEKP